MSGYRISCEDHSRQTAIEVLRADLVWEAVRALQVSQDRLITIEDLETGEVFSPEAFGRWGPTP